MIQRNENNGTVENVTERYAAILARTQGVGGRTMRPMTVAERAYIFRARKKGLLPPKEKAVPGATRKANAMMLRILRDPKLELDPRTPEAIAEDNEDRRFNNMAGYLIRFMSAYRRASPEHRQLLKDNGFIDALRETLETL